MAKPPKKIGTPPLKGDCPGKTKGPFLERRAIVFLQPALTSRQQEFSPMIFIISRLFKKGKSNGIFYSQEENQKP